MSESVLDLAHRIVGPKRIYGVIPQDARRLAASLLEADKLNQYFFNLFADDATGFPRWVNEARKRLRGEGS